MVLAIGPRLTTAGELTLLSTNYPPYFAEHLPHGGPITEIMREAFRRSGYAARVEFVPWIRAMQHGKAGKVDGLHGAWHSEERETWFLFSHPLPGNEIVLLKRRGDGPSRFTTFDALSSYSIGIVKGYRNPEGLTRAALRVDEASSDTNNIEKLVKRRVDLIVIERAVAEYLLADALSAHRQAVVTIEPPLEVLPLHVMISKKTADARVKLEAFNRGLQSMRQDGSIDRILAKHAMSTNVEESKHASPGGAQGVKGRNGATDRQ